MKIINFRGELNDVSAKKEALRSSFLIRHPDGGLRLGSHPVLLFSELNKTFFGYFDRKNNFFNDKIPNFRDALMDVSATTEAQLPSGCVVGLCLYIHSHPCFYLLCLDQ